MTARAKGRPRAAGAGAIWAQVFEHVPTALAVVDGDGCVVAMNHAFRQGLSVEATGFDLVSREPALAEAARNAVVATDAFTVQAVSSAGIEFECQVVDRTLRLVSLIGARRRGPQAS